MWSARCSAVLWAIPALVWDTGGGRDRQWGFTSRKGEGGHSCEGDTPPPQRRGAIAAVCESRLDGHRRHRMQTPCSPRQRHTLTTDTRTYFGMCSRSHGPRGGIFRLTDGGLTAQHSMLLIVESGTVPDISRLADVSGLHIPHNHPSHRAAPCRVASDLLSR